MRTLPVLLVAAALTSGAAGATEPSNMSMNAGELAHALDRAAHVDRVLYVAAHPDDENTRLLAYLANQRHVTAAYLAMTRGGGGQNLIGGEQGELLDVIRTEELMAARGLDGAEQRFTRMRDFGYSKSAEETLKWWGHDDALADVVWVIRTFQPDVIITRFDEAPPNHGHHTASAILAREAFAAAADPKRFPEQLSNGVKPWQATRLLYNFANFGDGDAPEGSLALDVGGYDARLGESYGELAATSRSQHKSQGFGVAGERGHSVEHFVVLGGSAPKKDILEGVDSGWEHRAPALAKAFEEARATLDRDHPERALPALARAQQALALLPDEPRVRDARKALARVAVAAAGLYVRATAAHPSASPGEDVPVEVMLVERTFANGPKVHLTFPGGASMDSTPFARDDRLMLGNRAHVAADAPLSIPYWLTAPPEPGHYMTADPTLIGMARTPPALTVGMDVTFEGAVFHLDLPVVFELVDSVQGERVREVQILPPATVTATRSSIMVTNGHPAPLFVRVRATHNAVTGDVTINLPDGWKATPARAPVKLDKADDEVTLRFDIGAPAGAKDAIVAIPELHAAGKTWAYREAAIDYPHIPPQLVIMPASVRVAPLTINLPAGLIGYVRGSGDSVAEDLAHIGLKVTDIDAEMLRTGDLSRFSSIVIGIRAFNVRADVRAAHPRLMAFVKNGGTLVVQYNTKSRIGPLDGPIGPYPLEIDRGRVTDETATMTPVVADHPQLRTPNKIGPADFEGWVQERGIYFASRWDDKYQPLFKVSDPKEDPQLGSTLVAHYGKGRYVYTGLVFFRELPAGVPGAYRLFVNLLAGG